MNLPLVNVERAVSDLKRGLPVIIHDKKTSALIATAENTSPTLSGLFIQRQGRLILSRHRASYMYHPAPDSDISIPWVYTSEDELLNLLWKQNYRQSTPPSTPFQSATPLQQQALKASILSEMLPALLFTSLVKPEDYNMYLTLSAEALECYEDAYAAHLRIACTAPLTLEGEISGSITAFTALGSAKEHYAICIGTPDSIPAIPPVRVHSSCYTGDLLASITCDCRDQLHAAIHHIAQEGGGIILYLMQEGRNIGLINKLRAYALKDTGLDTVEANHALGFSDDLRHFQAAARMLQLLGHTDIALLTNNPKKANNLTEYGITVSKTIPHKMQPHAYNQAYLSTKINRLGHTP